MIEQLKSTPRKDGGLAYWSFWVRLLWTDPTGTAHYIAVSGWKYLPDKGTLATPSTHKGGNSWFNTTKVNPEFYNLIRTKVEDALGIVRLENDETVADFLEAA